MKPETNDFLSKARRCLSHGKTALKAGLGNDAGRNAYLAAYHAAQAYIFETNEKIAKTHNGVRSEFNRLSKSDSHLHHDLSVFLSQAYILKEVADYETGEDAEIPLSKAETALETAQDFIKCIETALSPGNEK